MGIGLDLDDFGAGYSSLRYLRELPFDFLKIDRYFIAALDQEQPSSSELVQTIIDMAHHLGLQVVAEGIETAPHSAKLQKLGCRFGQGFYFSRPIDAQAMYTMLASSYQRPSEADSPFFTPESILLASAPGLA